MSRIVHVNGAYLPESEAMVSVFDRGFLMADGVYEVTSVLDGKLIDFAPHCVRLARSLSELDMQNPHDDADWLEIFRQMVARNDLVEGMVYLQVTRGNPGDRDFAYPGPEVAPTVVLFTQSKPGLADSPAAKVGWRVISIPDLRWDRRDIKTVQLLYPSMGKMAAKKAGVDDSWFVQDGVVTEGTSNNAYIVKGNRNITRPLSHDILHGITRVAVLRFAAEAQMEVEERAFSIAEAQSADAFSINGSANNAAASNFGMSGAFGNNRRGAGSLYTGNIGAILGNSVLDARVYSVTGQDTAKPAYNRINASAQIGGPLRIPHLFNANNAPNFFVSYQLSRNRTVNIQPALMPTALERTGVLGTTVLDPTTGNAFPGKVIPSSRISQAARTLAAF